MFLYNVKTGKQWREHLGILPECESELNLERTRILVKIVLSHGYLAADEENRLDPAWVWQGLLA